MNISVGKIALGILAAIAIVVLIVFGVQTCQGRDDATPEPPAPIPTTQSGPAPTAPVVPPVMPTAETVDGTKPSAGWQEVDHDYADDDVETYNHDNNGKPGVFLTWYFVEAPPGTSLGQCSLRVTTALDGERVSTRGAWRHFRYNGGEEYTRVQLEQLVSWWKAVLEQEPRGACASEGAYVVSYQEP